MALQSHTAWEALASRLEVSIDQVRRTVELLEDGNTLPFIARFRRDQTGGLDESRIREIRERLKQQQSLEERRDSILKVIKDRGELTTPLEEKIRGADSLKLLEDLYLPFKRKKETRASRARQRGLEPLADEIICGSLPEDQLEQRATQFVNADKQLPSTKEVIDGVKDLIVETIAERVDVRQILRTTMQKDGILVVSKFVDYDSEENAKRGAAATVDDSTAKPSADSSNDGQEATESETTEANTTKSKTTEPVTTEPVTTEPVTTEPDTTEPVTTEPDTTEPVTTEPDTTEPDGSESEPSKAASPESEPTEADSAVVEARDADSETAAGDSVSAESASPTKSPPLAAAKANAVRPLKIPAGVVTAEHRRKQRRDARRRKREQLEASFKDYFEFSEPIEKVPPHRILAINRGERVRVLKVRVKIDNDALFEQSRGLVAPEGVPHRELLETCTRDAIARQLVSSLDREIRRELTERAEQHALRVFARNLRHLLLQPPVRRRVLAIDPGLRFGCKAVAIDEYGVFLADTTVHAIGDAERVKEGRRRLAALINEHQLDVIAIGNGTGCRQAETTVATLLEEQFADRDVAYVIVNEAGASVYSTSELATRELPERDARIRGAISIGRRLLDPLSELVKIEPGNLGVGMYQHDVRQKHLQDSLDEVVTSCVNYVGVDLNMASPALLRYVSGMNQRTAREVYEYRQQHGPFASREQLKSVPGIGESTYEQAAGFLMVNDGENPFDATWVHPESYEQAQRLLEHLGCSLAALRDQVARQHSATMTSRKVVQVVDRDRATNALAGAEAASGTPQSPTAEEPSQPPTADVQAAPLPADDAVHAQDAAADGSAASPGSEPTDTEPTASPASESPASPDTESAVSPTDEPAASSGSADALHDSVPTGESAEPEKPKTEWLKSADSLNIDELTDQLGIGKLLVGDLVSALRRAGRDPREEFPPPLFRRGIMRLEDLRPNMELSATVLNVVDFGAFVDIGLRDSGLIHISQLADCFIRDPHEVVSVGDILRVWVMQVDRQRRRVSLTTFSPHSKNRETKPAGKQPQKKRGRPPKARGSGERPAKRGGPQKTRPTKRRPPKPSVPITDGMKNGSEPMRTFGDLAQFFDVTQSQPPKKGNKGKKK